MQSTPTSALEAPPVHPTAKTNYLLRIGAFAVFFASIGYHGYESGAHPIAWGLALLHLLLFPHVAYWVARRSRNSEQAEINNLTVDCLLFGTLAATLEFPAWITASVYLASTLNLTINRGAWGLLRSQIAFAGGALMGAALLDWHISPATSWPAAALSLLGCMIYIVPLGISTYRRNHQLSEAREALRVGQNTLDKRLIEIETLQERLREQASRDPLSGLYSRQFLDIIGPRELARCEREGLHMSLMMVEVDHFIKHSDNFGKPGADEILKRLAILLMEKVRFIDVACRYADRQFLLLLPSMPPDIAQIRAEQWRAAFAKTVMSLGALRMQATISIGIASYPVHGDTMSALAWCADAALHRAKSEGHNRVVLYQPPPST